MSDDCLLLIAREDDSAVRTLQQQASRRVVHVHIADLSRAGWRYESGRPDLASASSGGRAIAADRIAAVLCRIPAVVPNDLRHVHRDDRAYVASEINAFLFAWLAQFAGVRFNEPTWAGLAGPSWHPLQWTRLAAQTGVPVAPPPSVGELAHPPRATATATVVQGEVLGVTDPMLIDYARRIAQAARAGLLAVTFVRDRHWKFLTADPCADLDAAAAAAVFRRAFAYTSMPSRNEPSGVLCGAA
jgi:hypothetical protein